MPATGCCTVVRPKLQEIRRSGVSGLVSELTDCARRDVLRLRLRASPASVSNLRWEIRHWLTELRISREDILDLQLACSEALMLVVGGSAPPVALVLDVEGRLEGSTATVS